MQLDHTYATELADLVTPVAVSALVEPRLAYINQALAEHLGLDQLLNDEGRFIKALFEPDGEFNQHGVAQKYGGHQFGGWNPDLGDGRGLLLGEVSLAGGERWDLHLKGAGKTPYSRFGDGRAVLRSSIREYLASEALHHLGIPTSRALCLISSSEPVYRETQEQGAMLIRACQSHIRFGHFEYFYHSKQLDKLTELFNYTLKYHFPECLPAANPHKALLETIVKSTAKMIAKWQAFGFCHGVMNTDNMSIHGITFDFGPYAFLDIFEPGYICNHSDHSGRYAFEQQPGVALWNLNALAHGFTPYVEMEEIKAVLSTFQTELVAEYSALMRAKLGLVSQQKQDLQLVNQWLGLLDTDKRDYTQSFRLLSDYTGDMTPIVDHFVDRDAARQWLEHYQIRLNSESQSNQQRTMAMKSINPRFVLRNYLAQTAIEQAQQGDFSEFKTLLKVLEQPFDEQPEYSRYANSPPDWGQGMEISCSS